MKTTVNTLDSTYDNNNFLRIASDYIQLTKPRIMLLVVFSGMTALFMEQSLINNPIDFLLVIVALFLTGGSANALNQYFEREIDARMTRTMKRRPLPQGKISANRAFIFSVSIGLLGVLIFAFHFNLLSALLALGTILFYSLFYTLLLKPNTPQNIVIGGIAGAMPPLIAWAAATGNVAHISPWVLFFIIILWTPPHFWALALFYKDDYVESGLPMMPVVKGEKETLKQIFIYTIITVAFSLVLLADDMNSHWVYLVVAVVLGIVFIKKAYKTMKENLPAQQKNLFFFSIIYLFSIFIAIIIDSFLF